jgi:hypothetical protein
MPTGPIKVFDFLFANIRISPVLITSLVFVLRGEVLTLHMGLYRGFVLEIGGPPGIRTQTVEFWRL